MATPADKIVVTNLRALKKKYGPGVANIQTAIAALIAADKTRGITTKIIDVASAAAMKAVQGAAVTDPQSQKQNKAAIDAIYTALVPDYLMILGSIDVIPHQDLLNPLYDPGSDPDKLVPADLPYACEAAYSQDPRDFIGPTRVVGRLPDLTGGTDPAVLTELLRTATKAITRPMKDYRSYLGITAQTWMRSTALSLEKLFGNNKDLQTSPTRGPQWTASQLARRSHFINCHGAAAKSEFYGEKGDAFPVAHTSARVSGNLSDGTVASVECCYGAQLFDPAMWGQAPPLCNTYLQSGAYGYVGSTTISYGPADANGSADLLCQFFLQRVLAGASLGRAMLEARQQFAQSTPQLDPYDLKTLAQFNLLGDPALHPVAVPSASVSVAGTRSAASVAPKSAGDPMGRAINRTDRRRLLISKGLHILATQLVARRRAGVVSVGVSSALQRLAGSVGLESATRLSFDVAEAAPAGVRGVMSKALSLLGERAIPAAFHVMASRQTETEGGGPRIVAIVAKEVDGKIVSYRELHSR
ncbi:MAG TPA: C25 family cysteine peptidase [Chthoniobacteraceae bacterium]|jgi:hypothetical protein